VLAEGPELAAVARRYRLGLDRGDPVGRLGIPSLGLDLVVANGTDPGTLRAGPGRDLRSSAPGEGGLVYFAGHRTTYLAPFSRLDALRAGDRITLAVPYATFTYSVTHHVVVAASDLSVLRSPGSETLALQTCHPRFFASERYVVYARLVAARPHPPRGARSKRSARTSARQTSASPTL
jgi:sortase A